MQIDFIFTILFFYSWPAVSSHFFCFIKYIEHDFAKTISSQSTFVIVFLMPGNK